MLLIIIKKTSNFSGSVTHKAITSVTSKNNDIAARLYQKIYYSKNMSPCSSYIW